MARAAILFWDLDREIRAATGGQRTLDDVVRELIPIREVSEADLRRIATRIAGRPPKALDTPLLR
jgi:predicted metalloprotease with PDZ domain